MDSPKAIFFPIILLLRLSSPHTTRRSFVSMIENQKRHFKPRTKNSRGVCEIKKMSVPIINCRFDPVVAGLALYFCLKFCTRFVRLLFSLGILLYVADYLGCVHIVAKYLEKAATYSCVSFTSHAANLKNGSLYWQVEGKKKRIRVFRSRSLGYRIDIGERYVGRLVKSRSYIFIELLQEQNAIEYSSATTSHLTYC